MQRKIICLCLTIQIALTVLTALHFAAELAFDRKKVVLAATLYPWDYRYPFNVGAAYLQFGNYKAAEVYYLRTLKNFPTFLEAKNDLAVTWALMGRKKEARMLWREILTADPGYESARLNLEGSIPRPSPKFP